MNKITSLNLKSPIYTNKGSALKRVSAKLTYNVKNSNISIQILPNRMFEVSQTSTNLTLEEFMSLNSKETNDIFVKFLGKDVISGIRSLLSPSV